MIGQLATAILAVLDAQKVALGITGAEYAERGKMQSVVGPAVLLWIEPRAVDAAHSRKAYRLGVGIHLFCISSPHATQAAALDEAFTIAIAIANALSDTTVDGAYIGTDDAATMIELVESSSNAAVVAVNLTTEISLT